MNRTATGKGLPALLRVWAGAIRAAAAVAALLAGAPAMAQSITLSLDPERVAEDAGATTVTVTAALSEALSTATEVTVSRTGGTAASGTDYAAVENFTVTIQENQTGGTATFALTPIDDNTAEGDETVVLSGGGTGLTPGTATLTIADDDMASTALVLSVSPSQVWENAGETTITATVALNGGARTTDTRATVSVPQHGLGFAYPLTIPAHETRATRTFTYTPEDDSEPEPPKTVVLRAFALGLAEGTATLSIIDDDAASAIVLSVSPEWVAEDAGATTVTVTAALDAGTRPTATEVTVSRTGGTATSGTDYAAVEDFTVTIPAEQTSATAAFTITPTDDSAAEGAETVVLRGSATGLTARRATLTITDDDSMPTDILLSVSQKSVAETAGPTTVTVTAALDAGTRPTATNVLVLPTGGTATSGTDYAAVEAFTVTIPAEQPSATATFTFTPTNDSLREGPESVTLGSGVLGVPALAGWEDTATLTIADDDAAALVMLSVSPGAVWEHLGPKTVTVTAALPQPRSTATVVTVSRTGGSAIPGTHYAAVQDFTITIPAERTSATATFTFTPTDNDAEGDARTVILGENAGGRPLNTVPARLAILDDESTRRAIVLQVSPRGVEEHAGATTATVTATLVEEYEFSGVVSLNPSSRAFATEVTVSRTGGTATSGTDYAAVEDFTVTIPAGQESATATFTFTPTDDDAQEGNETVILSASAEALIFRSAEARAARTDTLTIYDDDTYVAANWLGKPSGLTTGDRFRLLFVTAAGRAPTSSVLAELIAYPGIGVFNSYVQDQADTHTIRPYSSHFRVLGSATEAFGHYTDARANTWTTYTDDHKGVPIYWLGGNKVADDYEDFYDGDWDDEANPTDSSGQAISAEKVWTGSNSDGTARVDYISFGYQGRSLGNWPNVGYGVLNDDSVGGPIGFPPAPPRTPAPAGIDDRAQTDKGYYALSRVFRVSTTTIDPTAVALSASPASVAETAGATTVAVTATLDQGARTAATEVTVSRTGGTATSGTDYAAVEDFTVTIPPEQASATATFTFTPTDDDAVESAEETVILSGSAAGLTGDTATLTIIDDDRFRPVFANSMRARSVAENTPSGANVGAAVTATNPANEPMMYTLGGTDVTSFAMVTASGLILTRSALDHETKDSYSVTVTAEAGHGLASATVPVTITVTDVVEPPAAPAPPTVVGTAPDSVQVDWSAPANTGPAIGDYDVRYRAHGSQSWIELDHAGTGLSTTVTGLAAGTYAAQVRATNPEGTGGWSSSGRGTTKVPATEVASGWSLAPSGLAGGDAFRLLFVSSGTRDATSTDIGDYNTFVQTAAAAGHADIRAYSAGFRAVASTADADARENTGTSYTDGQKGPPIYWLGGAKLADDYENLYDGKWDEEETGRDEAGASVTYGRYDFDNKVWTGSGQDGTELYALGTDNPEVGLLNFPETLTWGPLFGDRAGKNALYPLYGLSEVFQIGSVAVENSPPEFADATLSRGVAENSAAGTAVGAVIPAATDADGDTLTYSLEGADAGSFAFDAASRQIQTGAGVTLDHEAEDTYEVTVKADDANGGTDTVAVTITVTDVAEPPAAPGAPTVAAAAGSTTALDVAWTAPANDGKPAIEHYDVQYRAGSSGGFAAGPQDVAGTAATIASLTAGTEYEVQVRATNDEGDGAWSASGSGTPNSPPEFADATLSRGVAENSAAGTAVGAVIPAATDADGDTLTYSLEGADAGSFAFDAASRQIQTGAGVTLDHEADGTYEVTVKADDANGGTDTVEVTITVTDVAEPPAAPGAPTVAAAAGSTTALDVAWTAPANDGKPAIEHYDVQYRAGSSGGFTAGPQDVAGTAATIASLTAGTEYEVQVRATNDEGDGAWSPSGSGTPNSPPEFADATLSRGVAENSAAGTAVGAVIPAATDADGDTLTYSLEGADAGSFAFDAASRQIQTGAGVTLDHEAEDTYEVTVKADDANGGTDTVEVTITVTDVAEPPAAPGAPTVAAAAGSTTGLDVAWTAPANDGKPAIEHYDVQYRAGSSGGFTAGPQDVAGTAATIASLTAGTEYEVQVRATNDEGDGAWSASGSGTPNSPPEFADATLSRGVAENSAAGTAVGAVIPAATDADGDTLTYSLEGADAGSFAFDAASRQIQTGAGVTLDHEAEDTYEVTVKADDANGGTDTVEVTITVTDVAEPPAAPGAPTVAATAGSTTGLDVAWTAPANDGKPAIEHYDVQYRAGSSGGFTAGPQDVAGTAATIASLTAGTEYEVQVRATNDEGDGAWSPSGSGTPNSPPEFADATLSRGVAENSAAGTAVGAVIPAATDADGDTLTYTLEGADAGSFAFDAASRQIQTGAGVTLDHEADGTYEVTVKADDANGGTDTVEVTITVTDVAEPPVAPAAPTVAATAGSTTGLDVAWTAPANDGKPGIEHYDVQYRAGSSGGFAAGPQDVAGTAATIASLTAGTEYEVQVRATNDEGDGPWSASGSGTPNSPPEFADATLSRGVAENSAAGTAVGAVIPAATDADGDTLTYSLEGADAGSFAFDAASRQIQTGAGVTLDHEAEDTYEVTVKADDANGGTDTVAVTITVTDVAEPPAAPGAPTVAAAAGSTTALDVAWTAPANDGKPAIEHYDVQYRAGSSGGFAAGPQDVAGTAATIASLTAGTEYEVQVRATNDEGDGAWSASGSGTPNSPPEFADATLSRGVAENSAAGTAVGAVIPAATDADGDTLTYSLEGADAGSFAFDAASRQIQTGAGVTLDHEADGTYEVTVKADDANGGTDTVEVTITVTDVAEPPAAPGAPTVAAAAGSTTALDVAWTAPANDGKPAIEHYDVQYRAGSSGGFTAGPQDVAGTAATIASLTAGTEYEVQVRATNDEGDGAWSPSGSGTPNSPPEFADATLSRGVAENSAAGTAVGAVIPAATDADGDTLTYSLEGADAGSFAFDAASRQIQTGAGVTLDHEAEDTYEVTVKADDANGGTDTVEVTITVTDVAEPPVAPAAPTVAATAGSTTGLDVAWTAPANDGKPAIEHYDVQYRAGSSGGFAAGPQDVAGTAATIASLTAGTEYEVQVRATNDEGDGAWSPSGSGTPNSPPEFADATLSRGVAENSAAGTAVGAVIPAATDADGDTLTYTLEGADAGSFAFDAASRQIQTGAGVTLDHEADGTYEVTVKADDANGGTDTVEVTITVTDVAEPPAAPGAPTVAAAAGSTTALDVAWTAPANDGKPAIEHYDVQYRAGSSGGFTAGPQDVAGTAATIASLTAGTEYEVQVRATNDEGDGAWSPSGSGTPNSPPEFADATLSRGVAENSAAGTAVGAVIPAATDADGDTLTYSLEGADAGSFAFDAASRQIQTGAGVTLDHEADGTYEVTVKADDANGGTDTVAVTITVTDVAEPPAAPGAPTVSATAGSTAALDVAWTAPANDGKPAIEHYDVQYRAGSSGGFTAGPQDVAGTAATIASLTAGTEYEVQVRATNDEGDGAWSASGSGTPNSPPEFADATLSRGVAENSAAGTAVGAVIPAATDADGDTLTYSLEGADAGSFAFDAASRQIQTGAGVTLDHEAEDTYEVTVKADDANGGTDTVEVTITVTDVAEPPAAPGAPTVAAAAGSTTALDVAWTAPANDGKPAIEHYDVQYRAGSSGGFTAGPQDVAGTAATIASLTAGTEYEVQVRATNDEGDGAWSASGSGTPNSPPEFADATLSRGVAENSAAGTAVGAVIPAATDADGDTLTYSLEGADAGSFAFDAASRQIQTGAGVTLDHEAEDTYEVTVKADDANGGTDTVEVTITVTDVAEPPAAPAAPTVAAAAGSTAALDVAWTAPANDGKPAIEHYDVQYRAGSSGGFAAGPQDVAGTAATIASLTAGTEYEVQVRATNDEGDGPWSASGSGTPNSPPAFADATLSRGVAENSAAGTAVGAVIPAATDADGDTLTYSLEGADAGSFAFDAASRQIQTGAGVTLDHEAEDTYEVTVKADDANGGTDTVAVTITVTDVAEPPAAPGAPTVAATAGSTTALDVAWTAPDNDGKPAIEHYDVRYRAGSSGGFAAGPQDVAGTAATIASLTAGTEYEVQVRATNDEGDGPWSPSGNGTTETAALPALSIADSSAAEGDGTMTFAVTLSEAATEQVTVAYATSGGTATQGTDYTATGGTLTFQPGDTAETISVTLQEDALNENDETFQVTLSSPENATLADATATGTITDNDQASTALVLSLEPDSVMEDGGARSISVTAALDGAPRTTATQVTVSRTGGTATLGTDYQALRDFTLTIPANQASATATFTFTPIDDDMDDGDETVVLTGRAEGLEDGSATLTVTNDDQPSTAVALSVSPSSVAENGGARSVRVTATLDRSARSVPTNVVVSLHSQEVEFGPGKDMAAVKPFTIAIEPGRTSASGSFTLRPQDDSLAEGTESIEVAGEAIGLRVASATLELTDDDTATINLAVPYKSRHSEGAGATYVTVEATLSTARSSDTIVAVQVRGSGRSGVVGFQAVEPFELTIPAGQLRDIEGGFMLRPNDDDEAEGDETLAISGRTSGMRVTGTTFLLEDDDSETASTKVILELSETVLAESGGSYFYVTVTGTLDGAPLEQDTAVTLTPMNRKSDGSEVSARVDSGMSLRIRGGPAQRSAHVRDRSQHAGDRPAGRHADAGRDGGRAGGAAGDHGAAGRRRPAGPDHADAERDARAGGLARDRLGGRGDHAQRAHGGHDGDAVGEGHGRQRVGGLSAGGAVRADDSQGTGVLRGVVRSADGARWAAGARPDTDGDRDGERAGASGALGDADPGGHRRPAGAGLCVFRQRGWHRLRDRAREPGPRSNPTRRLLFRSRGLSHCPRLGDGRDARSQDRRRRRPDGLDGDATHGNAHDFDPWARAIGIRIGDGALRRSHRRNPALSRSGGRGRRNGSRPTHPGCALAGPRPAGRRPHGGSPAQPGGGSDRDRMPTDKRGRHARRSGHSSGGQRADLLVHRKRVHPDRDVRIPGVGALHRARGRNVYRRGSANGHR